MTLGSDSYRIREYIWDHLKIDRSGDQIKEISFDTDAK